ncbi:transposase [Streptococcus pneumoniae NP127]|nr:transposase [Streptococcus pneumoniae NP127]EHE71820.1 putative transposase [Streptococcus pneumoniae NorthCarolina6A-23]
MHLTNKEILDKILSYSEDLKHHYQIYQLLLFHFQNKDPEKFFGSIIFVVGKSPMDIMELIFV